MTDVSQGNALSCVLFNLVLEKMIRDADVYARATNYWAMLTTLALWEEQPQMYSLPSFKLSRWFEISGYTLIIKEPTTSNRTGQTKILQIGDYNFETVENFSYLGSKITTDTSYDDEIRARFLAANRAYLSFQKHFRTKCLIIRSKLLYIPRKPGFLAKKIAKSCPRSREESFEEFLAHNMRMSDITAVSL